MFTGIVKAVGQVRTVDAGRPDPRYTIEASLDLSDLPLGASIACSGCCLTVVDKGRAGEKDWFSVDVSRETLSRTALGRWQVGTKVNLEPSLQMGMELGGHIVTGHVDSVAMLETLMPEGGSHRMNFRVPRDFASFLAVKGSVAVEGISLTVNAVEETLFGVNIIPYTWENTNLSGARPGDLLNFEVDILARYVRRMLDCEKASV